MTSRPAPSRREFLAAGAALGVLAPTLGAQRPLWTPKVAMQLYCVRELLPNDPGAVFAALTQMGFQGLEFENWHKRPPAEWRKLLDANGLQAAGYHVSWASMQGDALKATVDDNATIGNKFLIVRSLPRTALEPRDNFMRTLEQFNQIAETLEPAGMRVGFHNHAEMFRPVDGSRLWDVMIDNTRADVSLQLDTGNAQGGDPAGVDIVQLLRRNPGRVDTMHVKPYSTADPNAVLGADQLPWAAIVAETRTSGLEWYIIEYEKPGDPLENMKANLNGFRKFYPA